MYWGFLIPQGVVNWMVLIFAKIVFLFTKACDWFHTLYSVQHVQYIVFLALWCAKPKVVVSTSVPIRADKMSDVREKKSKVLLLKM